jgi:hypothetical protein
VTDARAAARPAFLLSINITATTIMIAVMPAAIYRPYACRNGFSITEIAKFTMVMFSTLVADASWIPAVAERGYSRVELKVRMNETDSVPELELGIMMQAA